MHAGVTTNDNTENNQIRNAINTKMRLLAWATVTVIGGLAIATGTAPLVAGLLGFGSTGVGMGTLAAGAQAYVGNVGVGTVFAMMQHAAMVAPTP